jgi:hypothetical protein
VLLPLLPPLPLVSVVLPRFPVPPLLLLLA